MAGGAVACVRAVGPFEVHTARSRGVVTHLQRGPRGGSRTQPEGAAGTHAAAVRAPVRARAERAWGHGERVVAVPQHATRRCGGRAGMVWRWARERGRADRRRACLTRCRVRQALAATENRENQPTMLRPETRELFGFPPLSRMINKRPNRHARRHQHHASGILSAESRYRCILGAWPPWPPRPPLN